MYKNTKKPCSNCPFLKSQKKVWLGKERATEINESIMSDKTFHCHQTTMNKKTENKICAGSLILLEKEKGLKSNFVVRLGIYLGLISEIEKTEFDKVFDSSKDFIESHS